MAPMKFSKSHEREEARLMRKGFLHSLAGLLLCWLPGVGLLLAISGFVRVMVRITRKFRARRRAYLAFSVIALLLCTGALLGEVWVYSRDPAILNRIGKSAWAFVTGQQSAPDDATVPAGTAYTDMDTAGLGATDGLTQESDGLTTEDDWQTWDDDFDWAQWESSGEGADLASQDDAWLIDDSELNYSGDTLSEPLGDTLSEPLGGTSDAVGSQDGLEWLDEDENGVVWLDANGQPLPPETSLNVGPGEFLAPVRE